jgi:hypothetical protein
VNGGGETYTFIPAAKAGSEKVSALLELLAGEECLSYQGQGLAVDVYR